MTTAKTKPTKTKAKIPKLAPFCFRRGRKPPIKEIERMHTLILYALDTAQTMIAKKQYTGLCGYTRAGYDAARQEDRTIDPIDPRVWSLALTEVRDMLRRHMRVRQDIGYWSVFPLMESYPGQKARLDALRRLEKFLRTALKQAKAKAEAKAKAKAKAK